MSRWGGRRRAAGSLDMPTPYSVFVRLFNLFQPLSSFYSTWPCSPHAASSDRHHCLAPVSPVRNTTGLQSAWVLFATPCTHSEKSRETKSGTLAAANRKVGSQAVSVSSIFFLMGADGSCTMFLLGLWSDTECLARLRAFYP